MSEYVEVMELADTKDPKFRSRTWRRVVGGVTVGTVLVQVKAIGSRTNVHMEVRGDVPFSKVRDIQEGIERALGPSRRGTEMGWVYTDASDTERN